MSCAHVKYIIIINMILSLNDAHFVLIFFSIFIFYCINKYFFWFGWEAVRVCEWSNAVVVKRGDVHIMCKYIAF